MGVRVSALEIHVGTIIIVDEKDSKTYNGLVQALSSPVHYVGKSVTPSTLCIHVHARWWYQFSPLHSLSFSVPQRHRVITKRFAMAILADFFKKSGTVPYPVLSCRLSDA